jgi:hypothetical protein
MRVLCMSCLGSSNFVRTLNPERLFRALFDFETKPKVQSRLPAGLTLRPARQDSDNDNDSDNDDDNDNNNDGADNDNDNDNDNANDKDVAHSNVCPHCPDNKQS